MKQNTIVVGAHSYAPLLAILTTLFAFSLGLWRLETESIWHDEGWSIRAIDSPFGTPDDNTPPVYYITLHLLQQLGAGHSPFALRYGSVLINLLTVALAFWIGQRWYKLGFAAGLLMALSPLLWEYSQEVRAYIAVPLIALLLLTGVDFFVAHNHTPSPKTWIYFFMVEVIGLYTHNLVVLLIVWLNVMVFGFLGWASISKGIRLYAPTFKWIILQFFVCIAYLPWLLTQSPSGTNLNTVPEFGSKLSQALWRGYIFPVISDPKQLPGDFLTVVHLLPLLAGIALIILAWRGRNRRALLILSQVILLPTFSTLLLQRASIDFHPRYYILAVPSTMLLLVAAVGSLPKQIQWGSMAIILGVSAFITHYSLNFIAEHPEYQHDDFRGMAEYYANLPADTVILIPFDDEPALQYYYQRELDIQAEFLNIPLYSSSQTALETINSISAQKAELLTWFQVPADIRGMYGCLLGQIGEEFTSYGLHSQAYLNPAPIQMNTLNFQPVNFQASQMSRLAYSKSERQTCIMIDWQGNIPQELKTSLTLYNPFGEIITKTDSLILDNQQEIAQTSESFSLLELPQGLPANQYQIGIILYSETNPNGYDILDPETGTSQGKNHWEWLDLPYTPFETPPSQVTINWDNTSDKTIYSGLPLELEMISPFESGNIPIRLEGEDWVLEDEIMAENPSLVWHSFQIPPDASGTASLYFNDVQLVDYTIIPTERIYEAPETEIHFEAQFGDFVNLMGANLAQTPETVTIELVWKPSQTPEIDYWVFAQILNAEGSLLAQSDAEPIRPTSSWIPDEYILDSHSIKLDDVNYTGEASVIVGLYDPRSSERVQGADGRDFVTLPIEIILGDD